MDLSGEPAGDTSNILRVPPPRSHHFSFGTTGLLDSGQATLYEAYVDSTRRNPDNVTRRAHHAESTPTSARQTVEATARNRRTHALRAESHHGSLSRSPSPTTDDKQIRQNAARDAATYRSPRNVSQPSSCHPSQTQQQEMSYYPNGFPQPLGTQYTPRATLQPSASRAQQRPYAATHPAAPYARQLTYTAPAPTTQYIQPPMADSDNRVVEQPHLAHQAAAVNTNNGVPVPVTVASIDSTHASTIAVTTNSAPAPATAASTDSAPAPATVSGADSAPAPAAPATTVSAPTPTTTAGAARTHEAVPPVRNGLKKTFQRHPEDPLFYVELLTKGWAQGRIRTFMDDHIEGYRVARSQTYSRVRDYINTTTNEFFEMVPWRNKVSDPIPDDYNPHAMEHLSEIEEDQKAHKIESIKNSIKSWLDRRIDGNKLAGRPSSKENNVWTRLLKQLSGVPSVKPKKLSAVQFWSKAHYALVRSQFREKITSEYFNKLSDKEQLDWAEKAKADHAREVSKWHAALNTPVDTAPEARQIAIDTLNVFLSPILNEVHAATGFHITMFLCGPEPHKGGRLNVIGMHWGTHIAPSPQNWPAAQPQSHKLAIKHFLDFVETCFTNEMKAQSALKMNSASNIPEALRTAGMDKDGVKSTTHEASGSSDSINPSLAAPLPCSDENPARSAPSRTSHDVNASMRKTGQQSAKTLKHKTAPAASTAPAPPAPGPPSVTKPAACKKPTRNMTLQPANLPKPSRGKRKHVVPSSVSEEEDATLTGSESDNISNNEESLPVEKIYNTRHCRIQAQEDHLLSQTAKVNTPAVANHGDVSSETQPTTSQKSMDNGAERSLNDNSRNTVVNTPRDHGSDSAVVHAADPRTGVEGTAKTPMSSLQPLNNAPTWIKHVLTYLRLLDMLLPDDRRKIDRGASATIGEQQGWTLPILYSQLLDEYLLLEHSSNFSSLQGPAGRLDSKERPKEVHWWIARKQLITVRPSIPEVERFASQWWKWWVSLQPDWRGVAAPSGSSPPPLPRHGRDGDWSTLDKPGVNGFTSLVVCLKWWGAETALASKDPLWIAAVEDTKWVMSCIRCSRSWRDNPAAKEPKERATKRQRTV
ncbi:hypothetical protein CONPUDRAFT_152573 [Coniophora puteana RWD-64-598 SS2]|uniref:Uncharacterized protein n=1 Tax=Coniophora puteana (strain RWD-64-598) TaxID=741705 RepID=A0A5M3MRD5_CONPW|nr:uncharacterized protein CONPUDRAFT_152573 [Coniophora puteana RWD-64-598 SS2]EIW81650.1 hypothetical protein CONPUDRAFT_152573 [Coniophora puteana RWD-64-598 SS2]